MSDYFIVLTIGPVQGYISQARRTQDLFQGSRILSYLASEAVKAIPAEYKDRVIYPTLPADDKISYASVPNRVVVAWKGDESSALGCAKGMKNAVKDTWENLSEATLRHFLKGVKNTQAVSDQWEKQAGNWLECYWVVVPAVGETYREQIRYANQMMGARKLVRNFPYIQETGIKDSITGEHGVLTDGRDEKVFWQERKADQRNLALLSSSERLGAISTIKRFAHETGIEAVTIDHRYPSTSSIATASFKYDVLKQLSNHAELVEKLEAFLKALEAVFKNRKDLYFNKGDNYNVEYFLYIDKNISLNGAVSDLAQRFRSIDGDYLFEDTLTVKTIEEYSQREPTQGEINTLRKALKTLLGVTGKLDIAPPYPYLAILSTDGDHMGKALGAFESPEEHQGFSEKLGEFARGKVQEIVEEKHLGRLVYAGGDDVLALVTVRHALDVAEDLRKAFTEEAVPEFTNHKGDPLTVSTGIAFVHHTHDLQGAVRAANDTQKNIAKEAYGRNALAVSLLRRSGEPRTMGSKWGTVVRYVNSLKDKFSAGYLSRSLPYDIESIAYGMSHKTIPTDARHAELTRLVKRRLPEGLRDETGEIVEAIEYLAQGWEVLTDTLKDTMYRELTDILDFDNQSKEEKTEVNVELSRVAKEIMQEIIPDNYCIKREVINDVCAGGIIADYPDIITRLCQDIRNFFQQKAIEARWTSAQHWVSLARFIAQKESDR